MIVNTPVKYGLTGRSFTHTLSDRVTTPVSGAYRACSRELRRGPGNGRDVDRWVPSDGYPSYTSIPGLRWSGAGHGGRTVGTGRQDTIGNPNPMAWDQCRKGVNPFPSLPLSKPCRICVTSLTPGISSGYRSRTTVGRVRMYTDGIDNKIPTARRRARPLALGVAPESTVGDVPTVPRGLVAMTASPVRK